MFVPLYVPMHVCMYLAMYVCMFVNPVFQYKKHSKFKTLCHGLVESSAAWEHMGLEIESGQGLFGSSKQTLSETTSAKRS
jgi:hypothetical protein